MASRTTTITATGANRVARAGQLGRRIVTSCPTGAADGAQPRCSEENPALKRDGDDRERVESGMSEDAGAQPARSVRDHAQRRPEKSEAGELQWLGMSESEEDPRDNRCDRRAEPGTESAAHPDKRLKEKTPEEKFLYDGDDRDSQNRDDSKVCSVKAPGQFVRRRTQLVLEARNEMFEGQIEQVHEQLARHADHDPDRCVPERDSQTHVRHRVTRPTKPACQKDRADETDPQADESGDGDPPWRHREGLQTRKILQVPGRGSEDREQQGARYVAGD